MLAFLVTVSQKALGYNSHGSALLEQKRQGFLIGQGFIVSLFTSSSVRVTIS